MRRVRTTCTEFSFQIVHFLDRLSCLHQRIFGRTPREREAFRPNVHATCSRRYPQAPPLSVQGRRRRACSSAVADPYLRAHNDAVRQPDSPLPIHGRIRPQQIAGSRTRSGAVAARAAEPPASPLRSGPQASAAAGAALARWSMIVAEQAGRALVSHTPWTAVGAPSPTAPRSSPASWSPSGWSDSALSDLGDLFTPLAALLADVRRGGRAGRRAVLGVADRVGGLRGGHAGGRLPRPGAGVRDPGRCPTAACWIVERYRWRALLINIAGLVDAGAARRRTASRRSTRRPQRRGVRRAARGRRRP